MFLFRRHLSVALHRRFALYALGCYGRVTSAIRQNREEVGSEHQHHAATRTALLRICCGARQTTGLARSSHPLQDAALLNRAFVHVIFAPTVALVFVRRSTLLSRLRPCGQKRRSHLECRRRRFRLPFCCCSLGSALR